MKIDKSDILNEFASSLKKIGATKQDVRTYIEELDLPQIDREIVQQLSGGGLLVDDGLENKDIRFSYPDRLFLYKKRPVLAFQKDQHLDKYEYREKKFRKYHICFCSELQKKANNNQLESRYVITYNTSGVFIINIEVRDEWENTIGEYEHVEVKLNVCQDCLRMLNWKGFLKYCGRGESWYKSGNPQARARMVNDFSLKEYFAYAKEQAYLPDDFVPQTDSVYIRKKYVLEPLEKMKIKQAHDFRCDECKKKFPSNMLQIHHINHNEGDNWYSNLSVLCNHCHRIRHEQEDF